MANTSHPFALPDLIEEGVQKLKQYYKSGVDVPTLSMVWGHTCIFVEEQMIKGKAVAVPGLGTFSFVHKKQELGNRGTRTTRIPAFVAAEVFCSSHDVKKEHLPNLTGSVATVGLNYSTIASQSGAGRDVVVDFLKEVPKCIGAAARHNRAVSVELENIGYLLYSPGGTLKVSFNSDFVAQIRVSSTKNGSSISEDQTVEFNDSLSSVSKSPAKVNNFFASRPTTAHQESPMNRVNSAGSGRPVILPHMELHDRPGTPAIKMRANSDPSLRPSTGFSSRYSSIEEESSEDDEEAERQMNLKVEGMEMEKGRRMGDEKRRGNREGVEEEGRRGEHVHREERRRFGTPEMERGRRREAEDDDNEGDDEETCENCILAGIHDREARRKKIEERIAEEVSVKTQKSLLQAMEEKEQMALKVRKAMREEADLLNQHLLAEKQGQIEQQKKKDYYGNIFYARRPETPAYDKKYKYRSTLEEQIAEKLGQTEQRKVEVKKEFELLHETQKQADERARKQKKEEKSRQKEYSEFLMHQIQERTSEANTTKTPSLSRPLSLSPSLSPPHSSQDAHRPSTTERAIRRRSFDSTAVEQNKEAIEKRKKQEAEQRAQLARQQEEIVKANKELLLQQQQEEVLRKLQTRELLKTAWNSQLEQKRLTTISEINRETKPSRNSLDLGELLMNRSKPLHKHTHTHNCKKCGRDIDEAASKNFRRTSGDFRNSRNSTPLTLS